MTDAWLRRACLVNFSEVVIVNADKTASQSVKYVNKIVFFLNLNSWFSRLHLSLNVEYPTKAFMFHKANRLLKHTLCCLCLLKINKSQLFF